MTDNVFGEPIRCFASRMSKPASPTTRTLWASSCAGGRTTDLPAWRRGKCSIFLTSDNQSQPRMWVWIGVEDVRALHAAFVKSGAKIRNPPENFEWALEMQVEDLDANVLRIGSDPEKDMPLGVFRDADGVRWRHLGNQKYERVE